MEKVFEETCYVIVDGQDVPVTTEGRICVFTDIQNAYTYLTFFSDGEHRIVSKDAICLQKQNIYLDPPLAE